MHLRKVLTIGAAVVAAGLLTIAPAANATGGAAPTTIVVNTLNTTANVAIDGTFKGGTASFGGGTFGCTGGTVAGTVARGPITTGPDMSFSTLNIVCATPLGINATINLPANCVATFKNNETNTHAGIVDTGVPGGKYNRVRGNVTIPAAAPCPATISIPGGCSAKVSGTIAGYFDEAIKNAPDQTLGLTGTGLTLSGQTALCFGLLTGGVTLNNIEFNLHVTGGNAPGIDFQ